MRPIGFSTGALAKGDLRRGLDLQRPLSRVKAIELSALRDHELPALLELVPTLDLRGFDYVSVHAPSKLVQLSEQQTYEALATLPPAWPIVVHPCIVHTPAMWRGLGPRLCLENMDNRKTRGRNAAELHAWFEQLPEATFCLDVGHARQVDPTMAVALRLLQEHGPRLRQLHVSDVGPRGEHQSVGALATWAFTRVAHHVPESCPLIIESVLETKAASTRLEAELDAVLRAFGPPRVETPTRAPSGPGARPSS